MRLPARQQIICDKSPSAPSWLWDVGSWTYGRSQFAVVTEGNASLWQL